MKLEFIPLTLISVNLTRDEFDYIFESAKRHYSHDCRSMTKVGGKLYGWKGCWDFHLKTGKEIEDYVTTRTFENREFQLLIKSIEFDGSVFATWLNANLLKVLVTWQAMQDKTAEFMKDNQPVSLTASNTAS